MKRKLFAAGLVFLLSFGICLSSPSAREYASFSSFYEESAPWSSWAIAGGAALGTGLAVYFTGGLASPFAGAFVSILGGWLSESGLSAVVAGNRSSGIAAPGPVASGGLGTAGNTAIISAALVAATQPGAPGIESYLRNEAYENLAKELKTAPNFPVFVNGSGPRCIAEAKEFLNKRYDRNQLPASDVNRAALNGAIAILDGYKAPEKQIWNLSYEEDMRRELLRVYALKALLQFMADDNAAAHESARLADSFYREGDGSKDLILFILGTSGLALRVVDLMQSQDIVGTSLRDCRESPFLPLLYSIYLSRVELLEQVTPGFIRSFSSHLYGISEEAAPACYAFMAVTILNALRSSANGIKSVSENVNLLTPGNMDAAMTFAANSLDSYQEILAFSKEFNFSLQRAMSGQTANSMGDAFMRGIKQFSDQESDLKGCLVEINKRKAELEEKAAESDGSFFGKIKDFFGNIF